MKIQHKEMANGRWAKMSLCEQMANIGSEVSRALNWKKKGKQDISERALYRALELIDLTLAVTKSYPHLKEIARAREALVDYFLYSNEYKSSETLWRKYFDYFAYFKISRDKKGSSLNF